MAQDWRNGLDDTNDDKTYPNLTFTCRYNLYQHRLFEQKTEEGLERVMSWVEKYVPVDHPERGILEWMGRNHLRYLRKMAEQGVAI